MKKREQGILTVEASIVLTLCILFILFLFSFARVYSAQSMVSHAVLQVSDAIALESNLREATLTGSEADVTELANRFMGTTTISADNYTSLRSADIPKIAKEKFIYAIDNSEPKADDKLKKLGIKDGLTGLDFSASRIDLGNDDVIVYVTYTIEMQFPVFGMNEITVTKAAKSKTFGDILFGIETVPKDPVMGTASGGGNYKHGTQIQISASPNYGYKFKKWADGSTDNPRIVTVTGAKTYVAVFEPSEFGVTLVASPEAGGSTSGGGVYKYLNSATISATPATGYHFTKWSIYSHKDKTTKTDSNQTTSVNIDQSYTCTAYFEKNSYTVKVETSGTTSGSATIIHNSVNESKLTAEYQTAFKLSAPTLSGYDFLGWKEKNGNSYFSTTMSHQMSIPAKDVTYVACYKSIVRTVTFYNYGDVVYATRTVNSGSTLGLSMPPNPKHIGVVFNGWQNGFSAYTTVYDNMSVYGNWGSCVYHDWGRCGVDHSFGYQVGLQLNGRTHWTWKGQCIVCANCGIGAYTWKNGYTQETWTGQKGDHYGVSSIMFGQYCFEHSGCRDLYWDNRIYNIHY